MFVFNLWEIHPNSLGFPETTHTHTKKNPRKELKSFARGIVIHGLSHFILLKKESPLKALEFTAYQTIKMKIQ